MLEIKIAPHLVPPLGFPIPDTVGTGRRETATAGLGVLLGDPATPPAALRQPVAARILAMATDTLEGTAP